MEYNKSNILEMVKKILSGLENILYEGENFRVRVYKAKDTIKIDIKELKNEE